MPTFIQVIEPSKVLHDVELEQNSDGRFAREENR